MRKSIVLAIVISGVLGAASRGTEGPEPDLIKKIMDVATNAELDLRARTTAIEMIGSFRSEGAWAVDSLVTLLKDVPVSPKLDPKKAQDAMMIEYTKRTITLHAVKALGDIGPSARKALPALAATAKDEDPDLNKAIDLAKQSILTKPKPDPAPVQPVAPPPKDPAKQLQQALKDLRQQPPLDQVKTLLGMLKDPTNDPSLRAIAARELGILGKSGVPTDQQKLVVQALNEVSDPYLKAVVAEALKSFQ